MKDWQAFTGTPSVTIETSNFICDASETGLILVTGEDAESFLQNQFSNDINLIDETRFQLSSYSTPKGRLLAVFKIVQISNGYLLITPLSLVESLLQRLQMFVIQARVNLADASGHFVRFAIQTGKSQITGHPLLAPQIGHVKAGGGGGKSPPPKPEDQKQEPKDKPEQQVGDRDPQNSRKGDPKPQDEKEKGKKKPPEELKEKAEVKQDPDWLPRLPAQVREDVMNGNFESVPEKYRALVEAWMKKMSEIDK